MRSLHERLLAVYAVASGGDQMAYLWLEAFHSWAHEIDDFIDEPGGFAGQAVDLCVAGVPIFCNSFFMRHAGVLGPLIAVVGAKYRSSLAVTGRMADVLRLGGNDVVLMVAYLRGGNRLVAQVSQLLWPLVEESQLDGQTPKIP